MSHFSWKIVANRPQPQKNLRFFEKKIMVVSGFRPFDFRCKKKDFLVCIFGKHRFFARPPAVLTKILNGFQWILAASKKKGKFLHFLCKDIELSAISQKSGFGERKYCKNLTFSTLDSKVPKIEKKFAEFAFPDVKNARNIKKLLKKI